MARRKRRIPIPVPRRVDQRLDRALDAVLSVQRPAVLAYLDRMRARRPDATPAEVVGMLERHYLAAVTGIGAAAGGAAAMPGVGTVASLASGAAEVTAFVTTTAVFVLALAELHGIPVSDPQLRRALVLGVLLGDAGAAVVRGEAAQAPHWAQVLGHARREQIAGINSRVMRMLVARFGARQGALMVGRALPLGVGAGVGALGNAALARGAIASARTAFGPPPPTFAPRVIDA
jgi:hypothetical protein